MSYVVVWKDSTVGVVNSLGRYWDGKDWTHERTEFETKSDAEEALPDYKPLYRAGMRGAGFAILRVRPKASYVIRRRYPVLYPDKVTATDHTEAMQGGLSAWKVVRVRP